MMNLKAFSFSFLLLLFFNASMVETHGFRSRKLYDSNMLTEKENWFDQNLDHFSPTDHSTFKQRYFEYLGYYKPPEGPIFLLVGGESEQIGIGKSFYTELAEKFGAAIVSIEHRYYGKSTPYKELTTENLKYLSSKQAIFDLAVFRQYYQELLNAKYNVSETENRWFVIGGSYSGGLAAYFRLKFPHLTCGAYASSAALIAIYNFTEYDQQIGTTAGPECKTVLQEITHLVDEQLNSDRQSIKELFGASKIDNDDDFRFLVADAAALSLQYGFHDFVCDLLVNAKKNGSNILEAYADYVKNVANQGIFGVTLEYYDRLYLKDPTSGNSAYRLWWFYICSEMGYFLVAPQNDSIRSTKLDERYNLDFCKDIFGEGVYPDSDMANTYYGGRKFAGSRVIFTNGSQDPCRHISKQTSSKDLPSYMVECNGCAHGIDVLGCPYAPEDTKGDVCRQAVSEVRQKIAQDIDMWLSDC
ncbi:probable serine protease EDA2 [Musa acuminata AAA Group]|uniref:probable serine protease EDA2 n=1 Tax=Musa acuminata AAA Group TaxID=214697 RepID=UPI0031D08C65